MNIERLQRIKALILEEPRRLIMEGYHFGGVKENKWDEEQWLEELAESFGKRQKATPALIPPCGTAACICGWANILEMQDKGLKLQCDMGDETAAAAWLGISPAWTREEPSRRDVFHVDYWPQDFKARYEKAANPQQRAQAAADYIDFLCAQEQETSK